MVSDIEKMAADQSSVRPDYETPVPSRSHSIMSSSGISGHSSALEPIAIHHTDVHAINSGSNGYDISACMSRATTRDLERHPTLLSRMATQRSQHNETVGSTRSRPLDKPLPPFGAGKPYPPPLPEKEEYVVEFDGPDDPLHPQNWSLKRKIFTALILAWTTIISSFTSSIFSTATIEVSHHFGVSTEVGILGLSLFVLGYATGPIIWAPLSELRGRRFPIILGSVGFTIFQFGLASAKDLQTVMLCRFFGGFFGACPVAVVAAVFSDMFDSRLRGLAITPFSMTVFTGPLLAPFIGGFIVDSYLGWRWTAFLPGILGASALILNVFFLAETYPPVVLIEKAAELRRLTKNWGIHAKQEEIEVEFGELVEKNFSRPLKILFTEPIVLLLSIYLAFIYGLLYLFLTAYPIVFQQIHGFNKGVGGLPYFGMIIGQLIGGASIILSQPWYIRKLEANGGVTVPEWRLPHVMAGGVSFSVGLFWFGWTGYKADIHWMVPTASGVFTGFGLLVIFLQSLNYIIDAYLLFAASAIAANTLLRSLAGAVFPLFASYMFKGLGINWAGTLLGCFSAVLCPIPVVFYFYGHRIRAKSKFGPKFTLEQEMERDM
ncbi:MFS multidrug transporter [Trichophyton violaceum]|uniref:MFS multidrug transporter n=1 Tax=Trichophyton violaceum TaxID=34388 RepID=A0A178FFJ9_TRIVO|nr:MFS multidrug transporter [Trichophyton violaceum]